MCTNASASPVTACRCARIPRTRAARARARATPTRGARSRACQSRIASAGSRNSPLSRVIDASAASTPASHQRSRSRREKTRRAQQQEQRFGPRQREEIADRKQREREHGAVGRRRQRNRAQASSRCTTISARRKQRFASTMPVNAKFAGHARDRAPEQRMQRKERPVVLRARVERARVVAVFGDRRVPARVVERTSPASESPKPGAVSTSLGSHQFGSGSPMASDTAARRTRPRR